MNRGAQNLFRGPRKADVAAKTRIRGKLPRRSRHRRDLLFPRRTVRAYRLKHLLLQLHRLQPGRGGRGRHTDLEPAVHGRERKPFLGVAGDGSRLPAD